MRYFAGKGKMPKFIKGHYSCPDPTSFSSIPIHWWSYEALAPTVFEIFCLQGKNAQLYKGPLLMKYFSKFIQMLTRSSACRYQSSHHVSGSNSNSFRDISLTKLKVPKLQRTITQEVFFRIYSKFNQVIYLSLPIYSSSFKALALIIFEILLTRKKMPKFTKGKYSWNVFQNLFNS